MQYTAEFGFTSYATDTFAQHQAINIEFTAKVK